MTAVETGQNYMCKKPSCALLKGDDDSRLSTAMFLHANDPNTYQSTELW